MADRRGASRDTTNMKNLLEKLGFQVQCETNKTKDVILQLLREFAESDANNKADMVAIYIGSHGERDAQGYDTFVGVDGGRIRFDAVKEIFSPDKCVFLREKPKLFFLQFCREGNEETKPAAVMQASCDTDSTASDSTAFGDHVDTRLMDLVCVFATLAGNKAYRDTQDGSWFVSSLCRIIADHADKEDLQSMLTMVNNSVAEKNGKEGDKTVLQISEVVQTLRKKIFFWPGMK